MQRISTDTIQDFEIRHQKILRFLGPEGTLLLRTDGLLPLEKPCPIALFGSGARHTLKGGTGSGDLHVRHLVNIEEGLQKAGFTITSKAWLDAYDELLDSSKDAWIHQIQEEAKAAHMHSVVYSMGKIMPVPHYDFPLNYQGETAIYVLSRNSGEGSDRSITSGDILLTEEESRDIAYLNKAYPKFLLVLNVGGMVDISSLTDVRNILLLGQLGQSTGDILADLLLGKSYPSGKLPFTWARSIEDYPSTEGFGALSDVFYNEDVYVGYRYFSSCPEKILFPFGFGLSYTSFSIETLSHPITPDVIHFEFRVTNTGKFKGKEVLQLYVRPDTKRNHPAMELLAYRKTKELLPGESEYCFIDLPVKELKHYDEDTSSWTLEKGYYLFQVGNSSVNVNDIFTLEITQDHLLEQLKSHPEGALKKGLILPKTEISHSCTEILPEKDYPVTTHDYEDKAEMLTEKVISFDDVMKDSKNLPSFVSSLTDKELISLCLGRFKYIIDENTPLNAVGESGSSVAGSAGETCACLLHHQVPTLVMADGPAGLRIAEKYIIFNHEIKSFGGATPGAEFLTPEEKAYLDIIMPKPSAEELQSTVYYQYPSAILTGMAIASSFSENLAYEIGSLVGEEMEIYGVDLWLAPAFNIIRNPLCGRNFEYYSEDPVVSGRTAASICKGVSSHSGRACVIKHYACNNQETNRAVSNSVVSEKALREIYLKGFEICIKEAHPLAIMSANNLINGEHVCSSSFLMNDVLRHEWGFEGFAMTDWFVTNTAMTSQCHGSDYPAAIAHECIAAGNDIVMPGDPDDMKEMQKALENHQLLRSDLEKCAYRILKVIRTMKKGDN